MRHMITRRHGLLSDMLMAMKMEVGQTLQSHDMREIRRVVTKWEMILGELMPIKARKR